MYSIMRDLPASAASPYPPADSTPLIYRDLDTPALIEEYKKECFMIREGVDTDIQKCFEEGKAIIIEGSNLDPRLFQELMASRNIPTSAPLPPLLSPSFTSPPQFHPQYSTPAHTLPASMAKLDLSTPFHSTEATTFTILPAPPTPKPTTHDTTPAATTSTPPQPPDSSTASASTASDGDKEAPEKEKKDKKKKECMLLTSINSY